MSALLKTRWFLQITQWKEPATTGSLKVVSKCLLHSEFHVTVEIFSFSFCYCAKSCIHWVLGVLTQWRFVSRRKMVLGLHLAVFRPVPEQNAVELIADTYIDSLATPENREYTWVYYPVQPAIAVRRGDFLGMFYDRLETPQDMLTIVSKHSIEIGDKLPPTAVFLKDASDMLLNSLLSLLNLSLIYPFFLFVRGFIWESIDTIQTHPSSHRHCQIG